MKRILGLIVVLMIVASSSASAAPERITIKKQEIQDGEKTAKARLKNLDLRNIQDPAARQAIKDIMRYLGLKAKN